MNQTLFSIMASVFDLSPLPDTSPDPQTIDRILSIIFATVSGAAIVVITFAGLMYVLSHGDAKIIAQAKNAILYAVIGLVVLASAFGIVNVFLGGLR